MNFKKVNNITGWLVCVVACTVYIMTMEATGSLWDTGEFISSALKLQVPHPPGAPLFVILGRISIVCFSWLFGSGPEGAARAVNLLSALCSGFTILFLFWSITHFARKIVDNGPAGMNTSQLVSVMAAGVVGALAYTFSDSFWFSAVEGEVYAMSSLFTALVFWAMLKWEAAADSPGADKWIIFIFFMMGLSIGVHLLNLLTIPAIVMIYYFKRYNVTPWGTVIAFLVGCAITGLVQVAAIQYTVKSAGILDVFAVNTLGLPFFSGFAFYFIALAILLFWGINLKLEKSNKLNLYILFIALVILLLLPFIAASEGAIVVLKLLLVAAIGWLAGYFLTSEGLKKLKLGFWCFAFMLLGYSTYVTTMIRSNANPAVDMYNVDNPNSLVGYLGRDQYGDFPLVYGQVFTAQAVDQTETTMKYTKGRERYEEIGKDVKPVYAPEDMMPFPRVWDASNEQGHATFYKEWLNLAEGEKPSFGDNIYFFVTYQLNWMYIRYFMWNFAGKQNDIQGFGDANVRDGNWLSGISFLDSWRLGDQSKMPDSVKNNKANNKLFLLPFLLGAIGFYYQYTKNNRDFLVTFLLFFFTGLAIVLYLNQAGNQPRERDYAYVGSFYAFAIWIGLGVLQIVEWLRKKLSERISVYLAALLCFLAVPLLMGFQEWDDHDRSRKVLARDLAKDYLESCAPNAILFTYGDNDTYPLWYAQEVEGIRPDIRVVNNSLLGIDWYINQLRYKINTSDSIDVIWSADKIRGRIRDYVVYNPRADINPNQYFDLYELMKDFVGSDDPGAKVAMQSGESINYLPGRKFSVPVDEAFVRSNKTVNPADSVLEALQIEFSEDKKFLMKNDLAILNIIAANKWKRPIYFTATFTGSELGFSQYLRKDGLAYRLVPVKNNTTVNTDWMMDKLMNKYAFGGAGKKGVYFDEQNRLHLNTIRMAFGDLGSNLADNNRREEAKKVLDKADKNILESNHPYAMVSRNNQHNYFSMRFLEAAYKAEHKELAGKISKQLHKDLDQQMTYYQSLSESKQEGMRSEMQYTMQFIQMLSGLEAQYKAGPPPSTSGDQTPVFKNDSGQ
ncbi:MAG: MFS transporter [Chitinophagaceae bacterium]|nr:MFS transporter [Chitinophagaceae bacterium]